MLHDSPRVLKALPTRENTKKLPQNVAYFDNWKVHAGSKGNSLWIIFAIFLWLKAIQKRKNKSDHSYACLVCLVVMGVHIEAICSCPMLSKHTQKDDVKRRCSNSEKEVNHKTQQSNPPSHLLFAPLTARANQVMNWFCYSCFKADFPRESLSWFEPVSVVLW